jgi:hypothetical protein
LYHGGFNKNVYILDDEDSSPTTKRRRSAYRLLLGDMDDRSNEDAYIFSVMDLNKQMALPRHVCFKANNDKYGRVAGEHNYIEFTSDDIGDPAVRHSIHANGDGTVRIKSESLNRFWRLDPNWIKADYDYSDNDDQGRRSRCSHAVPRGQGRRRRVRAEAARAGHAGDMQRALLVLPGGRADHRGEGCY